MKICINISAHTQGEAPADSYKFFIDILLDTVRNEIGVCLERAYEKISLQQSSKRLYLKTNEEVKTFGAKVREQLQIYIFYFQFNFDALISQKNWTLSPDGFYHFASEIPKAKEPIPSVELAEQTIFYARELEMIV
jgi:26S proteasome regulatory subunit N12